MDSKELKKFCQYEVFEIVNRDKHTICFCKEYQMAELICTTLAKNDPKSDAYYYSRVPEPGTFVPGGGGYVKYQKNEDGKVERSRVS